MRLANPIYAYLCETDKIMGLFGEHYVTRVLRRHPMLLSQQFAQPPYVRANNTLMKAPRPDYGSIIEPFTLLKAPNPNPKP